MSNYFFKRLAAKLSREEDGQMVILMVIILPAIFLFFAMALDAGIWFFDHRLAQNQADAAALAAAQHLPAFDDTDARIAVNTWLDKNGSDPLAELDCGDTSESPEFRDVHPAPSVSNPPGGDGRVDWVRVCVRRPSPGLFSGLAGVNFIYVSAAATARVGPVGSIANVMPWGLVPPSPGCNGYGEACVADLDEDGIFEDCGYFPPVPPGGDLCPWGLHSDRLYVFKVGSGSQSDVYTPGNFGPIGACGQGVVNYRQCIQGELATGFYAEGETVQIRTQTGVGGLNTAKALGNTPLSADARYYNEAPTYGCDIESTPDPLTGLDWDGKKRAEATFVEGRAWTDPSTSILYEFGTGCDFRLVSIPVLNAFPSSGAAEDILVLGVSTFAIAGWDRTPTFDDDLGDQTRECSPPAPGPPPAPGEYFECGMVWGYLIADAFPPDVLVDSISDTANPFAPLIIVLSE